jgi:hypothetical protein
VIAKLLGRVAGSGLGLKRKGFRLGRFSSRPKPKASQQSVASVGVDPSVVFRYFLRPEKSSAVEYQGVPKPLESHPPHSLEAPVVSGPISGLVFAAYSQCTTVGLRSSSRLESSLAADSGGGSGFAFFRGWVKLPFCFYSLAGTRYIVPGVSGCPYGSSEFSCWV